jgi:prolyl 4-hydroxylase
MLIHGVQNKIKRSTVVDNTTGVGVINTNRTSSGSFYRIRENKIVTYVEGMLSALFQFPEEHGEGLQILKYEKGQEYKPHYDYFNPKNSGSHVQLKRGGQRIATAIVYLTDVEVGGATVFPDAGLEVYPKKGRVLYFAYPTPTPESKTLHGGAPVVEGTKWVATKWIHGQPFK